MCSSRLCNLAGRKLLYRVRFVITEGNNLVIAELHRRVAADNIGVKGGSFEDAEAKNKKLTDALMELAK